MIFRTSVLKLVNETYGFDNQHWKGNKYIPSIRNSACYSDISKYYKIDNAKKIIIAFSTVKINNTPITSVYNLNGAGLVALQIAGYNKPITISTFKSTYINRPPALFEIRHDLEKDISYRSLNYELGYMNTKTNNVILYSDKLWWWVEIVK